MTTTDSVFQRALSNLLTEIFDGPPGQEACLLNPSDPGLLHQLDITRKFTSLIPFQTSGFRLDFASQIRHKPNPVEFYNGRGGST